MTTKNKSAITLFGLGDMGAALAEAALNRGYDVSVWNRNFARTEGLAGKGAKAIADLEEALQQESTKIICVSDHSATMSMLENDSALSASQGKTLIQLSTVTSEESKSLCEWAEGAGAAYMDGQILSYPDDIREGRGSIVCSGAKEVFDFNHRMLCDLAGDAFHVGEQIGAAPAFDKAHLTWAMGNYLAFLQAAAMCKKSGVDLNAWCNHNLRYLESDDAVREFKILSEQVCSRTYDEGLDASLEVWDSVVDKSVEEFESAGMTRTHLNMLSELTKKAIDSGMGRKELGYLFELMLIDD